MLKHKLVDFIIQFMEEVDKEISEMKLFVRTTETDLTLLHSANRRKAQCEGKIRGRVISYPCELLSERSKRQFLTVLHSSIEELMGLDESAKWSKLAGRNTLTGKSQLGRITVGGTAGSELRLYDLGGLSFVSDQASCQRLYLESSTICSYSIVFLSDSKGGINVGKFVKACNHQLPSFCKIGTFQRRTCSCLGNLSSELSSPCASNPQSIYQSRWSVPAARA